MRGHRESFRRTGHYGMSLAYTNLSHHSSEAQRGNILTSYTTTQFLLWHSFHFFTVLVSIKYRHIEFKNDKKKFDANSFFHIKWKTQASDIVTYAPRI